MLSTIRNPILIKCRLIQTLFLAIFAGGVYFHAGHQTKNNPQWHALIGFLFFMSMTSFMVSITPIIVFQTQRQVFLKQQGAKMYGVLEYFLSRNIIQLPYLMLFPLLFDLIVYWMAGLANTPEQFLIFYLITVLASFAGSSVGLLIGSIADAKNISAMGPIFMMPFILFSGFFKNRSNLPVWIGWIQYLTPVKYSFTALTINQVTEQNPLISQLNFDFDLWPAIGMLVALSIFYRLLSLFFLWMLKTKLQ